MQVAHKLASKDYDNSEDPGRRPFSAITATCYTSSGGSTARDLIPPGNHQRRGCGGTNGNGGLGEGGAGVASVEQQQTQKFLGRMRAAAATEERFDAADHGKQAWVQKDAVAHSLYSRRLQVSFI